MIIQTIDTSVITQIKPLSISYQFKGGTATVELDGMGNYSLLVNGLNFSTQENSAKRDPKYKACVLEISNMLTNVFELRDAVYINLHKRSPKMQLLLDCQKQLSALSPQKVESDPFPFPRPLPSDVQHDLEKEAEFLFRDLYSDMENERKAFVIANVKNATNNRLKAYEEVQAFFELLQDQKNSETNAHFLKEYKDKKSKIESYIAGHRDATENEIRSILNQLMLPFQIETSCEYIESEGILNTEIVLPWDMKIPDTKTICLSSGKISVKNRLLRETEELRVLTILSLVYYVAASLFNASINIKNQRVTVWQYNKSGGILFIQFLRNRFSQINLNTENLLFNINSWPYLTSLRTVRGSIQLDSIDPSRFIKEVEILIQENANEKDIKEDSKKQYIPDESRIELDDFYAKIHNNTNRTISDVRSKNITEETLEYDPLLIEIGKYVTESGYGSTSDIQRKFSLGYNRAGKIMDQLEKLGIVGPSFEGRRRKVLVDVQNGYDILKKVK